MDAIPVGGNHITFDIARALATPVPEAERIKTLYGTLLRAQSDIHDIVSYPLAGEEEPTLHQTSKAEVHDIICPRVASTLELIDERIVRMGLARQSLERVVLTGGASQLVGMGEFAAEVFGRPVRIGRPYGAEERDEVLESPAFAAVFGLAQAAVALGDSERARAALMPLGVWDRVATRRAPAENVRAALLLVSRGETPLGIVYAPDAKASQGVRVVGTFPAASHPPIRYPLALLKTSRSGDAAAFGAFLLARQARAIFARHGFTAP